MTDPRSSTDTDPLAACQLTHGEPGDPVVDELAAEIERRERDV